MSCYDMELNEYCFVGRLYMYVSGGAFVTIKANFVII